MTLYERLEYINWSLLIVQDFLIFQVFIITVFPMYFDYQHVTSFYNIWILPSRADRKNKPEITCFRWKRHSLTLKEEFPLIQWRDVRYTTSISHFKNLYALALCVYRASGWTSVSLTYCYWFASIFGLRYTCIIFHNRVSQGYGVKKLFVHNWFITFVSVVRLVLIFHR